MSKSATDIPAGASRTAAFDVEKVRAEFPILHTKTPGGRPLVYLDNGATTQKPEALMRRLGKFFREENANIHRGVYALSQKATDEYEKARRTVQRFVNAAEAPEIIFTRGTTESINLVAHAWGRANLDAGDEVLVSAMEHHSNIVPWQMICQATGATLRVIPMNDSGELRLDEYAKMLSPRTKMVAVVHLSNSLGTINDVKRIAELAHAAGAKVLIDGAQWVAHYPTDVREIGCDFYAFSAHKLYGPTGLGVLYGRRAELEAMPPYQGGGDMIESVSFAKTTYAGLPNKFEAGTPHVAGAVALGTAIEFVESLDWSFVGHEHELLDYATDRMGEIPGLRVVGTAANKGSVISFVFDDPPIATLDVGTKLDALGVAVRTGHHCCQPVMDRFGIAGTARASFAMYNTKADVDVLVEGLKQIREEASRRPTAPVVSGASSDGAIAYPAPAGSSPDAVADELAETFELLGDRDARSEYVLDLAGRLPHLFDTLKVLGEDHRVKGCMSQVYLFGRPKSGSPGTLEFVADADAAIVRGLIAIMQHLFAGQSARDVLAFDVEGFFRRIQLDQFITSQRRNGLAGMVRRIRSLAESIATPGAKAGG